MLDLEVPLIVSAVISLPFGINSSYSIIRRESFLLS
jgi:hypothetical protein